MERGNVLRCSPALQDIYWTNSCWRCSLMKEQICDIFNSMGISPLLEVHTSKKGNAELEKNKYRKRIKLILSVPLPNYSNLKSNMWSRTLSPERLWNLWKWPWAIWSIFKVGPDLNRGCRRAPEGPSHLHDPVTNLPVLLSLQVEWCFTTAGSRRGTITSHGRGKSTKNLVCLSSWTLISFFFFTADSLKGIC